MKLIYILSILTFFNFTYAQEFTLDTEQSTFTWIGYGELGDFIQTGNIQAKEGSLTMDNETPSTAEIIIDMKSIDHEDDNLRQHLTEKDFFHVKKYPEANIKLINVSDGKATIALTIKGLTNQLEIPYEMNADQDNIRLKGEALIDRTKFDIKYNSSTYFQDLGSYAIKNIFDLNFELVFNNNQ